MEGHTFKLIMVVAMASAFIGGFALGQTAYVNNAQAVVQEFAENNQDYFASLLGSTRDEEEAKVPKIDPEWAKLVTEFNGSETESPFVGNPNAPVTIIEYSDYQCPYCGSFYSNAFQLIKKKYIETGQVKLVFKDYPLSFHQHAQVTARAAHCSGEQGNYWDMHDEIFANQQTWTQISEAEMQTTLVGYAKDLNLDTREFSSCIKSDKYDALIKEGNLEGASKGVDGTPGFDINGQIVVGAQPFTKFDEVIQAELR